MSDEGVNADLEDAESIYGAVIRNREDVTAL